MITLIGLGVNGKDISLGAFECVKSCKKVFVRTALTESVAVLKDNSISFESFDEYYQTSRNFDTLNKKIMSRLSKEARQGDICYLVDGAVDEDEVCKQVVKKFKNVKVFNGVSKCANSLALLGMGGTYSCVSAHSLEKLTDSAVFPLVIYDIDDVMLASRVKYVLSDFYGEERTAYFTCNGKFFSIPVYELDLQGEYNYTTCLVLTEQQLQEKQRFCFNDLLEILRILRGENGCPWDKAQTRESIVKNLIEECYELVDAIYKGDDEKMREEIGDNLMQACFHILFGEESGAFDKSDVISDVCTKLIQRHTHIFGGDKAGDDKEALAVWERNKNVEKHITSVTQNLLEVPSCFPALMRAQKLYKRAVKGKMICEDKGEIITQIKEANNLSDILFSAIKLAYLTDTDAEETLAIRCDQFIKEIEQKENFNK